MTPDKAVTAFGDAANNSIIAELRRKSNHSTIPSTMFAKRKTTATREGARWILSLAVTACNKTCLELGEVYRCCGLALDEPCGRDRAMVAAGNWLEDLLFHHLSELGNDGVVGGVPEGCVRVMWLVSHEAWWSSYSLLAKVGLRVRWGRDDW
jgi:hypothetical protein